MNNEGCNNSSGKSTNRKNVYSESDDEEEAQMVKWSGTVVLPKLEHKLVDPAMDRGDCVEIGLQGSELQ